MSEWHASNFKATQNHPWSELELFVSGQPKNCALDTATNGVKLLTISLWIFSLPPSVFEAQSVKSNWSLAQCLTTKNELEFRSQNKPQVIIQNEKKMDTCFLIQYLFYKIILKISKQQPDKKAHIL